MGNTIAPTMSFPQQAMLRALVETVGDRTVASLARRAGTNRGGATRTLRSLEDRGLARELFDGRWTPVVSDAVAQAIIEVGTAA